MAAAPTFPGYFRCPAVMQRRIQPHSTRMRNGIRYIVVSGLLLGLLTGCAGSSVGERVQQSLEPDPRLEESSPFGGVAASTPADTTASTPLSTPRRQSPPAARNQPVAAAPEPGDRDFVGPLPPSDDQTNTAEAEASAETDNGTAQAPPRSNSLAAIPEDLRPYVRDLQALDLLSLRPSGDAADTNVAPFNQPIARQDYARWLLRANNRFYEDQPAKRIRPGTDSDSPAFQDVPTSHPDFAAIQGLAEAGIIPSALTGNSTAVNFRPEAPLDRESLILWKVPLDTRASLPQTTPEAIQETWGFQDVNEIEPLAQRAIAADFRLGDFSNIRRAFGYTTLFQPDKAVTRAEAAATLWRFGDQTEGISAQQLRQQTSSTAQDN